ncbi:MAG: SGNH/GDSL hydrolase family protein [Nitrospinales bacterium]
MIKRNFLFFLTYLFVLCVLISNDSIAGEVWVANMKSISSVQADPIRYVAIGDSYTVGARVSPEDSWPFQLTQRLKNANIPINLIANLGRTGWTAKQAVYGQLPLLEKFKPDFITVLIGVNDWIRGVNNIDFSNRIKILLDGIQKILSNATNILIISIPDFSCTPGGKKWGYGKSAVNGIARLNKILKSEAELRGLPIIDITPLSRELCPEPKAFANDGVHPSRMQYTKWVDLIYDPVYRILKSK